MHNLKTDQKEKKTICEHTRVNCSCRHVRCLSAFITVFFRNFQLFERSFLIGRQKSKITNTKAKKQKKQQQRRCKAKTNPILWFNTKQENKQKNKNKRTSWNKNQNKNKKIEPETEMRNRDSLWNKPKSLELQGKQWFSQQTERNKHKQTQTNTKQNKTDQIKQKKTTPRPIQQTHRL